MASAAIGRAGAAARIKGVGGDGARREYKACGISGGREGKAAARHARSSARRARASGRVGKAGEVGVGRGR